MHQGSRATGIVVAGGNCGFTGAVGITSGGSDVDLRTGALLDIEQAVDAGAGVVQLLVSGGGLLSVTQAATGVVSASALSVQAPAFIDLDYTANAISDFLTKSQKVLKSSNEITRVGTGYSLWIEYPDLARSAGTIVGGFASVAQAEEYHTAHPGPRP